MITRSQHLHVGRSLEHLDSASAMDAPSPPYAAIVVLPYTCVKRRRGSASVSVYRMSHFTARCILAGLELYQQGMAPRFILPGEQHGPATSDLEQCFLLRRGVQRERILNLPDRNGTLQQLDPVAHLQRQGRLGNVIVVCFAFHAERVRTYLRLLGIRGQIAEVEQVHVAFLRAKGGPVRVSRETLLNLPQLAPVRRAEQGINRGLLAVDRFFGRWCPASRVFKLLAGPTITDIDRGRARVGLVRLEAARAWVGALQARARRPLRWVPGRRPD